MSTGDIRNGPYASRAKEYVWSTIADAFPRNITPTDIDGLIELNRCFFLFEGKTEGKRIDKGQALCLRRLLLSWPPGRAVVVVGEHAPLDRVDVLTQLKTLTLGYRAGDDIRFSPPVGGCIANVAEFFVRDSATGYLHVEQWHGECLAAMAPFGDAA